METVNCLVVKKINHLKIQFQQFIKTFDEKDLYPSIEEKAANLLSLVTKNHSFSDGNKRIAAFFVFYIFWKEMGFFMIKMEKRELQIMR